MLGDRTFYMPYDMVTEKVGKYIFLPFLTSLFDKCDKADEYWTFLEKMYPQITYSSEDEYRFSCKVSGSHSFLLSSILDIRDIPISSDYVSKYDRLLCGGIWCIVGLEYEYVEEGKKSTPIRIVQLTPIQMPHIDMDEIKDGRRAFTKDEWIPVLLR